MKKILILVVLILLVGCKKDSKELIIEFNGNIGEIKQASYIFIYNEENPGDYQNLLEQLKEKNLPIYLINSSSIESNIYDWNKHHENNDIVVGSLDLDGNITYYESANGLEIDKLISSGDYTQIIRDNEMVLVSLVAKNNIDTQLSEIQVAYFPTLLYVNDGLVIRYKENVKIYDEIEW